MRQVIGLTLPAFALSRRPGADPGVAMRAVLPQRVLGLVASANARTPRGTEIWASTITPAGSLRVHDACARPRAER